MLPYIRQMTEEYGKRENLSSQWKEDRREVGLTCTLRKMRIIFVLADNSNFGYSYVTNMILSFLINIR
jgi:hypothetical protein